MKKLITLSALIFSVCFLFSCTKDSQSLTTTSSINQNGNSGNGGSRMTPTPAPHPDIAGDWTSVRLQQVTDGVNFGLHGVYSFKPLGSEYMFDMKLVFIRTEEEQVFEDPSSPAPVTTQGYAHRASPTNMMTSTGKVQIAHLMTTSTMDIGIAGLDPTIVPNVADFDRVQFRYFFVTRNTYLNNPIDWKDYNAVIAVLNTAP
jgi:hypothetical protein